MHEFLDLIVGVHIRGEGPAAAEAPGIFLGGFLEPSDRLDQGAAEHAVVKADPDAGDQRDRPGQHEVYADRFLVKDALGDQTDHDDQIDPQIDEAADVSRGDGAVLCFDCLLILHAPASLHFNDS